MLSHTKWMVLAGVALAGIGSYPFLLRDDGTAPDSSAAAAERVERAGLYWTTDSETCREPISPITVSRARTSALEAAHLNLGTPAEGWAGKARIYGKSAVIDPPPGMAVERWGARLVVCGDPELVREIIRLRPQE